MSGDALGSAFRDASRRIVAALAWLYRTAYRCAVDILRRRRTEQRFAPDLQHDAITEQPMPEEWTPIPDERLRLIFVCCHPAVAPDARAALTLRLVCGLATQDHAVRADLLRKAGRHAEARDAYDAALALAATSAERLWLQRQRAALTA